MSELERRLAALAAELEWPETPPFELRLEPAPALPSRRRRRRGLVVTIALVVVAIGIAFAVPPARSAILDFFHLGGVTVERVDTLPDAPERPLESGLGAPVGAGIAEAVLGAPFLLPDVDDEPQLYETGGVVSAVVEVPERVLISQFRPSGSMLKKLYGMARIERAPIVPGTGGFWIAGQPHVVYWLEAPPRLAGNVLLWERGGITYRVEGKTLTKEHAVELARQMLD